VSDDSKLVPNDTSELLWMSGVEAKLQDGCSTSESITLALDSLKGALLID